MGSQISKDLQNFSFKGILKILKLQKIFKRFFEKKNDFSQLENLKVFEAEFFQLLGGERKSFRIRKSFFRVFHKYFQRKDI